MRFLPILFVAACGPPDVGPVPPPLHDHARTAALEAPGAPAWRAVDHLEEARFVFEPTGAAPEVSEAHPLPGPWRTVRTEGRLTLYAHDLPVQLPRKRWRQAPAGLAMRRGEDDVRWRRSLHRRVQAEGWYIDGDTLYVAAREAPSPGEYVLDRPGVTALVDRFHPTRSGLTPQAYVQVQASIGEQTRACLLAPAPGTLAFDVPLAGEPLLQFGYGPRPPVDATEAEGAAVQLRVEVDGDVVWRSTVQGEDSFRDATVSLSRYAGRTVSLTLGATSQTPDGTRQGLFCAPSVVDRAAPDPRRVVVVGIDTFRPDFVGLQGVHPGATPELDLFAEGSFLFDRAYAPAPRTKPSFRTAFTGRYPLAAVEAPTVAEVFHEAGFATAGVSANVHLVPRFGFADGFDLWVYENGARAHTQVERALAWLEAHAGEDTYLFVHIMDPHIFYDAPGRYRDLFVEDRPGSFPRLFNRWEIQALSARGKVREQEQAFVRGLHLGEVRYTSSLLARLFSAVEALPGRTLWAIHSDHGEEFWEHDGFEHNHTLYDELVRVLLWIRPPGGWRGGPHRVDAPVGLVDLAPTLFDLAGIPEARRPPSDGRSLRPLMSPDDGDGGATLARDLQSRPLHLGYLMYDKERWGVVRGTGKYLLETASGAEELYDLAQDPGEQRNLAPLQPDALPAWRAALEEATGWPVGPGWRIDMGGRWREPFLLEFSAPVRAAGVVDPEASVTRRANVEWGEQPRKLPEEVAAVVRSDDGLRVEVTPGKRPTGTLYVVFEGTEAPAVTISQGETRLEEGTEPRRVNLGNGRLVFEPGTVIAPQDSMRERFASTREDDETMEALRALGYVE